MSVLLKWVLVALVVGLGYNWWRRQRTSQPASANPPDPSTPQLTQACAYCGVHAASLEMIHGRIGNYCCIQHCQAHGDTPTA
jgi:hypothetical protein